MDNTNKTLTFEQEIIKVHQFFDRHDESFLRQMIMLMSSFLAHAGNTDDDNKPSDKVQVQKNHIKTLWFFIKQCEVVIAKQQALAEHVEKELKTGKTPQEALASALAHHDLEGVEVMFKACKKDTDETIYASSLSTRADPGELH